jgi:transcriptional regulator with XRE-family HTH domain
MLARAGTLRPDRGAARRAPRWTAAVTPQVIDAVPGVRDAGGVSAAEHTIGAGYALAMAGTATGASFGPLLREWRHRRGLSQLELSLETEISTRHLSFVETGRSRPSRATVARLAETLEIPLRERNTMLLAAGYAPLYGERPLAAEEMAPVRTALDRFLRAHEPYPALVVDRRHELVAANDALLSLTAACAPELLEPPANAIRIALHPQGMAQFTLNLPEWSSLLLARLRREAAVTADPELERLHEEVSSYPGVTAEHAAAAHSGADVAVPLRLRVDGAELAFLSTISTFGTPVDVTLSELAIEAFYPADAPTAMRLLADVGA